MSNLDLEIPEFDFDLELNLEGLTSVKSKETGLLQKAAKAKKILDAQAEEKKVLMRERQKHMDTMLDTEYYFCVYFKNHEERKKYLQSIGLQDSRYISSSEFVEAVK
jgi:hypothetical protein